jgi:hypothetical protein
MHLLIGGQKLGRISILRTCDDDATSTERFAAHTAIDNVIARTLQCHGAGWKPVRLELEYIQNIVVDALFDATLNPK